MRSTLNYMAALAAVLVVDQPSAADYGVGIRSSLVYAKQDGDSLER
jgi:hypothetical protein